MNKSRKYAFTLDEHEGAWRAQITRQVSSKKLVVSKEQSGFNSEAEATRWAEAQLTEFAATLEKSNTRRSEQRILLEKTRRERSNRRAEKTLKGKQEKANQDSQDIAGDEISE